MNRQFGKLPRSRFVPPKQTRGGAWNPDKTPETPLTGTVQNLKAAQGEERLSRTTDKGIRQGLVRNYIFRWTTAPRWTLNYKELDQLTFKTNGEVVAISVKGEDFVHKTSAERNQDRINELIILAKLREYGLNVSEIKSISAEKLKTQDEADEVGRKLGIYR